MSAALIAALRESGGYLRDDGYHQTAQLMALAADEIERLNRRLHTLEAGTQGPRPAIDRLAEIAKGTPGSAKLSAPGHQRK